MAEAWERMYVADQRRRGHNPDKLEVCVTIWATFDNFISYQDALALGEDGGEQAGLKRAWAEFVRDEHGILQALQNADKIESEWEVSRYGE